MRPSAWTGERHASSPSATQRQFDAFMDASPNVAYLKDADSRYVYINRLFETTFGVQRESFLGLGDDAIHPADRLPAIAAQDRALLLSGVPEEYEESLPDATGQLRIWRTSKFPVELDAGTFLIGGISTDVTERRRAEDELRASEALSRSMVEASPDCIKTLDLDGRLITVNGPGLCALELDDFSRIDGAPWCELWPEAMRPQVTASIRDAVAGRASQFQGFAPTAKGTPKWWNVVVVPVLGADGRPSAVLASSRDVTGQQLVEAELRASEEQFRTLATLAPIGIFVTDPEARYTFVNTEFEQILGRTWADGPLPDWPQCVHPDDRARVAAAWHAARTAGEPFAADYRLLRADGTSREVETRAVALHREAGTLIGFVGTVRDITERNHAEQQLSRRTHELARSNEELERFAYVASHDLQEPLRTVSSFAGLMRARYAGRFDADGDTMLRHLEEGATRMRRLIQGLLAYSRAGVEPERERTEVVQLVRAAQMNLASLLVETGGRVELDTLPTLALDARGMEQVFQNLIANALKFRGTTPPVVRITAQRDGALWEFCVADNGIGLAPEHASRIFQLFQRLHTEGEYPGAGIGLAVCQRVIEAHGGRIWAVPRDGGGTDVRFTLPAEV